MVNKFDIHLSALLLVCSSLLVGFGSHQLYQIIENEKMQSELREGQNFAVISESGRAIGALDILVKSSPSPHLKVRGDLHLRDSKADISLVLFTNALGQVSNGEATLDESGGSQLNLTLQGIYPLRVELTRSIVGEPLESLLTHSLSEPLTLKVMNKQLLATHKAAFVKVQELLHVLGFSVQVAKEGGSRIEQSHQSFEDIATKLKTVFSERQDA